jgi:hypothetical protein
MPLTAIMRRIKPEKPAPPQPQRPEFELRANRPMPAKLESRCFAYLRDVVEP